jgi:hypothetical protein
MNDRLEVVRAEGIVQGENEQTMLRRVGYKRVCPGVLSRQPYLLILSGFGRSKGFWVLDRLVKSQPQNSPQPCYQAKDPLELFALACSILRIASQAMLVQAISRLRTLWCQIRVSHRQGEPLS